MEKVSVRELREGMRVGQTIHTEQGSVLLVRGTRLTSTFIAALANRGFLAIYVQDGIGDDILPEEVVSQEVRIAVRQHLRELMTASPKPGPGTRGAALASLRPDDPQMAVIYDDVIKIVQEVMNTDAVSGVASLKSHDNYTFEHSVEVTVTGVLLGKRLGLPVWDLHQLALGCLCHDVGKVVIPPDVLNKPGRLTSEEFDLVKLHPSAGYEAARKFMKDDDIIARSVVWQHHERQDGTGYPQGFAGMNTFACMRSRRCGVGAIAPASEVAAVADVYSALASDRQYRLAMEPTMIVRTIREMAGSHLNAAVAACFLAIIPLYPVGTKVVVTAGSLKGYLGVVTDQNPRYMDRPLVRIVADATGRMITPREVDTGTELDIELAVPSLAESLSA